MNTTPLRLGSPAVLSDAADHDFGISDFCREVPWLGALTGPVVSSMQSRPPAHDLSHVLRVVRLARSLRASEPDGGDVDVLTAAAFLHELVNLPKNDPEAHESGDRCAVAAHALLVEHGAEEVFATRVATAIREHAFSKGRLPSTPESRLLQDADRLDAMGAVGIARCFGTSTEMMRPFFAPKDPTCETRAPNDKAFALDHFFAKLLVLPAKLHTETARRLAVPRVRFLRCFVEEARRELADAEHGPLDTRPV